MFCLLQWRLGVLRVVNVNKELCEQQIGIAQEKVVVMFLEHGYGREQQVVGLQIMPHALVVAGKLILYARPIILITVGTQAEGTLKQLDALHGLGIHLPRPNLPEYGTRLKLTIAQRLGTLLQGLQLCHRNLGTLVGKIQIVKLPGNGVKLLVKRLEMIGVGHASRTRHHECRQQYATNHKTTGV